MGRSTRLRLRKLKSIVSVDSFHGKLVSVALDETISPKLKPKPKPKMPYNLTNKDVKSIVSTIKEMVTTHGNLQDGNRFGMYLYFKVQEDVSKSGISTGWPMYKEYTNDVWTKFVNSLNYTSYATSDAENKCDVALDRVVQEFKKQHPKWIVWCEEEGEELSRKQDNSKGPCLSVEDGRTSWTFWFNY